MGNIAVHRFKDVYLEVEGRRYHVSSIVIVLQENGIPVARLVIDPAHVDSIPDTDEIAVSGAIPATFTRIVAWNKQFQDWAVAKKRATFHLSLMRKDAPDTADMPSLLDQELKLVDWVITGAGIAGASTAGNFALRIELSHPFTQADYAPSLLGGFTGPVTWLAQEFYAWDNIPAALGQLFETYATATEDASYEDEDTDSLVPDNAAINSKMNTYVARAADMFTNYLIWNPDGYADFMDGKYTDWPLSESYMSELVGWVKYSLAAYVEGAPEATPYELLVRRINNDWGTVLVPTFWQKELELRPYSPWLHPAINLESTDISDITFSGVDPAPVAGIVKYHRSPASDGDFTVFAPDSPSELSMITKKLVYMPPGIAEDETEAWSKGRILHLNPASWILEAGNKDAASDGGWNSLSPAEALKKLITPANTDVEIPDSEISYDNYISALTQLRKSIRKDAEYVFMTKFRQNVTCSIKCRLLISMAGSSVSGAGTNMSDIAAGWVIPGYVVRVWDRVADTDGTEQSIPVFDFYCSSVLHSIDCQSGQVYTELHGSYVRPMLDGADSGYAGIFKSGDMNPLWKA